MCRYCFNLTRRQSPTYIQTYSTAIDLKYDPESFRYDPKTVQRPSLILQMLSARRIIPNSSFLSMSGFCSGISHIDLYQIVLLAFTVGRHIVKQCCYTQRVSESAVKQCSYTHHPSTDVPIGGRMLPHSSGRMLPHSGHGSPT